MINLNERVLIVPGRDVMMRVLVIVSLFNVLSIERREDTS